MTQPEIDEINLKLDKLQGEINAIQWQLNSIKSSINTKPQPQPIQQPIRQQVQQPIQQQPQQSKPVDFEKTFGKSWMGAIASVLIFISIIMFAMLLIPFLTDVLKLTAMFVFSIALTVFGLYKLYKNDNSPFYMSVSGCGIGAIYISLLMSNIYFKIVNDVVLFLLILIWAVAVCVINRKNRLLFHVIGQMGISIAVVTGAFICAANNDGMKFLMLTLFFAVSTLLFFLSNFRLEPNYKIIDHCFNLFNLFWIICGYEIFDESTAVAIICFIYIVGMIFACFKLKFENNIPFGILTSLYGISILAFIAILGRNYDDTFICTLSLILGVAMILIAEFKIKKPHDIGKIIMQVIFICVISSSLYVMLASDDEVALIMGFLLLLLGFWRKDFVYKYASLCHIFFMLRFDYDTSLHALLCIIFYIVLFVLLLYLKDQYCKVFKIISYVSFILAICCTYDLLRRANIDRRTCQTIIFAVISILNIVAIETIGMKNFKTLEIEKAGSYAFNIINAILMIVGLMLISSAKNDTCLLILIITTLALFSVNSLNLLRKYDNKYYAGIYVGIKYTWLMVTILNQLSATDIVISIACLVLAIVCILAGFGLLFKSLRIYGLALSILSVAKLILFDINYDNLTGRAVGFFVCGVLCFGISLVYNLIDKKMAIPQSDEPENKKTID